MTNAKLTQDELQAIRKRLEKAPAGPWTFGEGYEQMEPGYYFADAKGYITLADEEGTVKPETIDFIVNAQQDVTKLLTEIERLQAEVHEHSAHNGQLIATHVIPTKEENKRLRKALEFYADKANYGVYTDATNNCPTTNTLMDDGHIAREALK